jgi:hypothetical protein
VAQGLLVHRVDWSGHRPEAFVAQQRITTEEHRKVVARFIRWSLEKRLRSMSPVTDSAFLRAKQAVTVTIEFCNWLAAEYNTTVEQLTQAHIDLWQSTGPTTREHGAALEIKIDKVSCRTRVRRANL